jgi:O-antigen/teichoic acid export membrane protein
VIVGEKAKTGWGIKSGTVYMAFSYSLSTVLVLGFQVIAVRILKPEQYGLVSVLYSSVVFLSLFLGQTFELTLSRYVSEYEAKGLDCFSLIKQALFWQACALVCFLGISILLRDEIIKRLFPEMPLFFYVLIACGVCYSFEVGIRGVMRGLREFGYYGTVTITINLFRIVFLLLLVGVMQKGLLGAGLSILLASIANVSISFFWYLRAWDRLKGKSAGVQGMTLWRLLQFVAPTMAMFGCGTYFYNTGPMFIKLLGGQSANELAGLFLIAVMISRLPLQLSEALSTNLLPNMSRLSAQDDWRSMKHYITKSYQLFVPLSLAAIVGVYLFGPYILRLLHPEFSYSRLGLTLLMSGTAVIMLVAAYNQFLLARSKMTSVVIGWLVGCGVLTAIILTLPGDILFRLEIGYLVAAIAIWIRLAISANRSLREMQAVEKHKLPSRQEGCDGVAMLS